MYNRHVAMKFDVITLFPEIINSYCSVGIIGRACREEKIVVDPVDLRPF